MYSYLYTPHFTLLSANYRWGLITNNNYTAESDTSVSTKGWYHGTPPPFTFKLNDEKHHLITLTKHCRPNVMYHWCTPPIFILGETLDTQYIWLQMNTCIYMYIIKLYTYTHVIMVTIITCVYNVCIFIVEQPCHLIQAKRKSILSFFCVWFANIIHLAKVA